MIGQFRQKFHDVYCYSHSFLLCLQQQKKCLNTSRLHSSKRSVCNAAITSISVHTEFFLLSLNSNFTLINPKSILGTDRPHLMFHRSKNWGSENFILTSPNQANNLQDSLDLTSRAHGSSSVVLTVYVFCVDIFSKGILFGN